MKKPQNNWSHVCILMSLGRDTLDGFRDSCKRCKLWYTICSYASVQAESTEKLRTITWIIPRSAVVPGSTMLGETCHEKSVGDTFH